jgi:hypothetical protein
VDDTVDLLRGRRGPKIRAVTLAASGFLGYIAAFGPAKGVGLTMGVALRLVELLAETLEFVFQFGDAAITLLTAGTSGTRRSGDAAITLLTAGTSGTRRSHDAFPNIG